MAPGALRKLTKRTYPSKPQQISRDHSGKIASANSVILRSTTGLRDEESMPFENEIGGALSTGTQNSNSGGGHRTTPTRISDRNDIPRNTVVPPTHATEIAAAANSDIQATESLQVPLPNASAAEASGSKKRGRGQTMGKGIMRMFAAYGKKMKIDVDPSIGRPIDADESAKLASQIGVINRDVLPVPNRWKEVDEEHGLEPGFDHLKIHMDVDVDAPGVRGCLIERFKSSSRQKRHKLHQHFQKYADLEEAKANKPSFCPSQQNWDTLCEFFATPKFKHVSDVNKRNRRKLRCKHISGRKAFTVRRHEISKNELNGEPCDRIELYKRTHCSEIGEWKSDEAKQNWEMMVKKREQYEEDGIEKTDDEIAREVLGPGSGYIKGLGYGPKPPSRRNTSYDSDAQRLQKELQEAHEKLEHSEIQVNELKSQVTGFETEVTDLKDRMNQQGATIEKLMAYLASTGAQL